MVLEWALHSGPEQTARVEIRDGADQHRELLVAAFPLWPTNIYMENISDLSGCKVRDAERTG